MLNNKGFVVSTILYTLLIAFLLFLGVLLSTFSSSTDIISNANSDLVNSEILKAQQVYEIYTPSSFIDYAIDSSGNGKSDMYNSFGENGPVCGKDYKWYQKFTKNETGQVREKTLATSNMIVKINSRYGTLYWPRDFDQYTAKSKTGGLKVICNWWPSYDLSSACQPNSSFYELSDEKSNKLKFCDHIKDPNCEFPIEIEVVDACL